MENRVVPVDVTVVPLFSVSEGFVEAQDGEVCRADKQISRNPRCLRCTTRPLSGFSSRSFADDFSGDFATTNWTILARIRTITPATADDDDDDD